MSCNSGDNCNNSCGCREVITKRGEQGAQGDIGPPGATGADGVAGPAGAISLIQDEGNGLPVQSTINFIGDGVEAVDNPGNNSTDVEIIKTPISAWTSTSILPAAFTVGGTATLNSTGNLLVRRTIIDKTAILNFSVSVNIDTVGVNETVSLSGIDISALLPSAVTYSLRVPVVAIPSGVGTLSSLLASAQIVILGSLVRTTDIVIPDIVVGRAYEFNWQMIIALD